MAPKVELVVQESRMATLTVQAPSIHIYPFSRLVNAPAGRWEKLIADLEAKQRIVYRYYQPVREAVVQLASNRGARRNEIYEEMSHRASEVVHSPSQYPVKDNQKCFECFEKDFLPKIGEFKGSLLRATQMDGTFFNGIILKGLPHMVVTDKEGKQRYVYLYPSSWKDHELDAYMELLTIIIESEFGADAADLWCMGLKTGHSISRPRSKARTRKACHEAAKHFKRVVDAGIIKG
ncbi:hypothetical protein AciX8_4301 [Granulicella mallensis MP5ACTX8]|uniref:Uncharacterized protein n=2 Tax=Granulicella mallensis TaxID=940614 RepID=G8NSK0_GRAMM|nr:hypothetical protein AciX8_4301 [Granulicella mallensis MP5ACTX8]